MKRTVLISGGSRGIGRATALLMAQDGWNVALTYNSDSGMADKTVSDIQQLGSDAIALQGDVASETDVLRNFDETLARFSQINAVVVNAGIVGQKAPLADISAERLRKIIDINILGAFFFAREASSRLSPAEDCETAALVFVSSAAARLGSPNEYVDYAASKGAIDTLTIGLSKELAPKKIRVNAVRPGLIDTEIHASGGQPDRAERLGKTVPMERPGSANEVGRAIAWLCSEDAAYTTGALLDVAGGR